MAAFFLAGLGPVPSHPVAVRFIVGDSVFQIVVDPRRHMLRAVPALRLTSDDVDHDSTQPKRRMVSLEPGADITPAMSLIAWRDAETWRGAGGTGRGGRSAVILDDYSGHPAIDEWRFYVFEPPPRC